MFQPGCKFETMLCLVGGQGAGKSSFFRLLAVKDEWFSDDLRRLDDDNVYRKLQGHWIIEMSEMIATANAKSIWYFAATLKRPNILYLDNFFRNSEGSSPNSFLNTSENLLGLSYPILAAISVMLSEVSRSKIVAACIR